MKTVTDGGVDVNRSRHQQSRSTRAEILSNYEKLRKIGVSERKAAESLGLPRSTLQSWISHSASLDSLPEIVIFFESPPGLAFLHRFTHAMHLIFVELGGCGIRLVCRFLELTGLNQFVASSYESQRRLNVAIENTIVDFGQRERSRLALEMRGEDISVAQNETFTSGLTLVAYSAVCPYSMVLERSENLSDSSNHLVH